MASRDNPTTKSPRQDEAQHGYEEHVQSGAEARGAGLEVQQARGWEGEAGMEGGCAAS